MSIADFEFVSTCRNILRFGMNDKDFPVRPHWEDGTPAHTIKLHNVTSSYNLENGIPIMTLRKQGIKNAVDEILWIYQKTSNKISDLHSHIWDSWDIGDGTIGKAYGYQIGKPYRHHKFEGSVEDDVSIYPSLSVMTNKEAVENGYLKDSNNDHDWLMSEWVWMDQIDAVRYDIKNNPMSRSIITTTYNFNDLADMGLHPCAYSMTYNVRPTEHGVYLDGLLNQRSQDMLTANNWNVIQYSILLTILAKEAGYKPGRLMHVIGNCHIYDRHVPIVEELIKTYEDRLIRSKLFKEDNYMSFEELSVVPYPNPDVWINPDKINFYDYTVDDFKIEGYQYCEFNHKIEVAI